MVCLPRHPEAQPKDLLLANYGEMVLPGCLTLRSFAGEAQDDVSGWWAGRDSRGLSDFHLDNCLNNLKFDLFSPSQPDLTRIGF